MGNLFVAKIVILPSEETLIPLKNVCKAHIFDIFAVQIARSSNGRTSDFDSDCIGSNPVRATPKALRLRRAFLLIKT